MNKTFAWRQLREKALAITTLVIANGIMSIGYPALARQSAESEAELQRAPLQRESRGQESENELETDRDSVTPATSLVGVRRTVVESSYSFIENSIGQDTHSFPELLVRYGLTKRFEIRLGWNYETGGVNSIISGNQAEPNGEGEEASRLLFGGKFGMWKQHRWLPESALIIQGLTPTSGDSSLTAYSITPVFGWALSERLKHDFACRFQSSENGDDNFNVWTPSSVIKLAINERWTAHAEYFSVLSDGRDEATRQHFLSPGVHRLLNSDMEVGVRVGWGLNRQSPDFFSNIGIGWMY